MELAVTGVVEGITVERFQELAEDARVGCPVSKALAGNVVISLEARLA
jgi:osmotically inducible protein OsmC